jgi:hypothetical protein
MTDRERIESVIAEAVDPFMVHPLEVDDAANAVLAALEAAGYAWYRPDEDPGTLLVRLLFQTTVDYYGNEDNHFDDDVAFDLRNRWVEKHGADIEESLNLRGADVNAICSIVVESLRSYLIASVPVGGDS